MFQNQIFSMPFRGVTRHLIIINVLMFIGTTLLMGDHREIDETTGMINQHRMWLASFFPTSPYFRSWQIVSHMFMHANLQHLLFNMFSLYMFGSMVEMVWGERKFLFFYLFCGLGAWALHMGVTAWEMQNAQFPDALYQLRDIPMLGASGAIYGVMAGFALLFPTQTIQLLFPPIPIQARYFVLGLAAIDLYSGISGSGSGVAHFAHIGGALFGAILFFYWNRNTPKMGW